MPKRPIVMVSSTAKDLPEHREQVRIACEQAGFAPHMMMEHLSALDADAVEASLKMVDGADVYLGIFAFRYGYIPDGFDISITEMEYNRAVEREKPRLIFFMDEDHAITSKMMETGDIPTAKLKTLKERAGKDRVVGFFKNPDDLRALVLASLSQLKPYLIEDQVALQERRGPSPEPIELTEKPTNPLGPNPYVGLGTFRMEDADRFFGREELIKNLWQHFATRHGQGYLGDPPIRFLAILGASGSGKSSVAQAGLLAEVRKRPLPGRPDPRIAVLTPEAHPLESLALALSKLATDDHIPVAKAKEFEKILREQGDADGLRFLVDSLPDKSPIILLVDQFEEVYSLCEDNAERLQFIENLLRAAKRPDGPLSVLLTLRSDFLGAVNDHRELSNLIATQHEVVPAMRESELRRAIEEPAKAAGRRLDPAVVELLIEQSADEQGALPLLEFALSRIWDGLRDGKAETETLRQLGGVGGALAKEAGTLFDSLATKDQAIARRAFLAMVRLGEGARDTRRRALLDEVVAAGEEKGHVKRVLSLLSKPDRRLITLSSTEEGEPTVEVSHEAIIDHWSDLRAWLDSQRDDLRFQRRLDEAATAWKSGYGGLWSDVDLGNLRSFVSKHELGLTSSQVEFYQASESRRRRALWLRSSAIAALVVLTIYAVYQGRIAGEQARKAALRSHELCVQIVENFVNLAQRQLDTAQRLLEMEGRLHFNAELQSDLANVSRRMRGRANSSIQRSLSPLFRALGKSFSMSPSDFRIVLPVIRDESEYLEEQIELLEDEFSFSMEFYEGSLERLRGFGSSCIEEGIGTEASERSNAQGKRNFAKELGWSHINQIKSRDELEADIRASAKANAVQR